MKAQATIFSLKNDDLVGLPLPVPGPFEEQISDVHRKLSIEPSYRVETRTLSTQVTHGVRAHALVIPWDVLEHSTGWGNLPSLLILGVAGHLASNKS